MQSFDGVMAVESFYVISGFYMTLVLSTRYRAGVGDFYHNRLLRLFPVYWMMVVALVATSLAYLTLTGRALGAVAFWLTPYPWWQQVWAAISNFTIIGIDWAMLASFAGFTSNPPLNELMALQPAWTISVELLFYAVVPFLLRLHLGVQGLVFLATVAIRVFVWHYNGGQWTTWSFHFSPSSWPLFMAGVFSYHLFHWMEGAAWSDRIRRNAGRAILIALLVVIVLYNVMPVLVYRDWRYYGALALALPFIFFVTRDSALDATIGEFSYPIYLAHWVGLALFPPLRHWVPPAGKVYVVLLIASALAAASVVIDRRIQRRFKRRSLAPDKSNDYPVAQFPSQR